ncbi:hypothetical protein [Spirillospora sp. NPDC029432]
MGSLGARRWFADGPAPGSSTIGQPLAQQPEAPADVPAPGLRLIDPLPR